MTATMLALGALGYLVGGGTGAAIGVLLGLGYPLVVYGIAFVAWHGA